MNDAETQRLSAELSAAQAENEKQEFALHEALADLDNEKEFRAADNQRLVHWMLTAKGATAELSAAQVANAELRDRELSALRAMEKAAIELSAAQTRLTQTAALADEFALLADEGGRTPPADDNGIKIGLSIAYEDAAQRLHAILAGSPRPNTQDGTE